MFVKVTSGYLFARLTSAPPGLRLELNFSIDVAYKLQIIGLDVTQKVISRIENGSRVVADYELDYLATALGTTINHLLGKE